MKISALILGISALAGSSAYAQTCSVDMVRNGRVIETFFSELDQNGRCRDALRDCARARQQQGGGANLICEPSSNPQPPRPPQPPMPQPPRRDVFSPLPGYSIRVGEFVMEELQQLDDVAYVRFASVYRNFREARDFEDFVGSLSADDD